MWQASSLLKNTLCETNVMERNYPFDEKGRVLLQSQGILQFHIPRHGVLRKEAWHVLNWWAEATRDGMTCGGNGKIALGLQDYHLEGKVFLQERGNVADLLWLRHGLAPKGPRDRDKHRHKRKLARNRARIREKHRRMHSLALARAKDRGKRERLRSQPRATGEQDKSGSQATGEHDKINHLLRHEVGIEYDKAVAVRWRDADMAVTWRMT